MKKGATLVELVVAMGIFTVVAALAVGAYVTVSRMKSLSGAMRESQQKIRYATEYITRLSKQADRVIIEPGGTVLVLYFNSSDVARRDAAKFEISGTSLLYSDHCSTFSGINCTEFVTGKSLLSTDTVLKSGSLFSKIAENGKAELQVTLNGEYGVAANGPYYNDNFSLTTAVIMENVK